MVGRNLASVRYDVETARCSASHAPNMFSGILARRNVRPHDVARLKAKMTLLAQAVADGKPIFVRAAALP